jgi:hypothetical protein
MAAASGSSSASSTHGSARSSTGQKGQQRVPGVGSGLAAATIESAQQPRQQAGGHARLPCSKAVGGPGPPS